MFYFKFKEFRAIVSGFSVAWLLCTLVLKVSFNVRGTSLNPVKGYFYVACKGVCDTKGNGFPSYFGL